MNFVIIFHKKQLHKKILLNVVYCFFIMIIDNYTYRKKPINFKLKSSI